MIGGADGPLSSVEEYRVSTNLWTIKSSLPNRLRDHGCVYHQGTIVLTGGNDGNSQTDTRQDSIHICDVETNTWTISETKMWQPIEGHAVGLIWLNLP